MEPEQVRNIMDSMIRKLYDMELEEQGRSDWQNGSIAEEGKRYLKEHFLLDISAVSYTHLTLPTNREV